MQTIFADATVSMSEFKRNPAAVLRDAGDRPVAVLNHNRAAFYMVGPELMEAVVKLLGDRELLNVVRKRRADGAKPIEVDIEDL